VLPDEQMWSELQEIVKAHPAKWMIWEGEPKPESVSRLKAMGIDSIVYDPCGNRPETGDFITVMKQNIENLRKVFGVSP
jgi:zinc transport system substrate-binding protein